MNVLSLLTCTRPEDIAEAHNRLYPNDDDALTVEFYRDSFLPVISKKIIEQTGGSIVIDHVVYQSDSPEDCADFIDVSFVEKDDDTRYSMSFQDWSIVLGCEVVCNVEYGISQAEQAAHVFWELTWHNLEEDTIERKDQVMDAMKEVQDLIDARNAEKIDVPLVTTTTTPVSVFEMLFPDETPEQHRQMMENAQKRAANMATMKKYRNGVLQDKSAPMDKTVRGS